jgi:hypothetical protein
MDIEARRRVCVEFRVKLRRDTGANLAAAVCEALLGLKLKVADSGEEVTLKTDPGHFYRCLGAAIAIQALPLDLPDHVKVAWWCYHEAAEVHTNPGGMGRLAECYQHGVGVAQDRAKAAIWYQKASDLGDVASTATLGSLFLHGDARIVFAQDAARGFALVREAAEQGHAMALLEVAHCYFNGRGVEKDAVHGVALLRQVITHGGAAAGMVHVSQLQLALCYKEGIGVEADTVQAALWCQRAADGGDAAAVEMLPLIRTCDFCSSRCGSAG